MEPFSSLPFFLASSIFFLRASAIAAISLASSLFSMRFLFFSSGGKVVSSGAKLLFAPNFAPARYEMSTNFVKRHDRKTSAKAKAHNAFEALWACLKKCVGGGGGNRTRVRETFVQGVYRFRSGTIFVAGFAPDQAAVDKPSVSPRKRAGGHTRLPAR